MSRKIIIGSMTLMVVGVLVGVVFFLSLSVGSVEKSDPAMLAVAEVEPQMAMAAPDPPGVDGDEDADTDGDGVAVEEFSVLVQQAQKQQVQIQDQQDLTDAMLDEVNAMRGILIEKRFESLDKLARRRGWYRNRRIPKEGSRHWDEYQEWAYLRDNREEVKKPKTPKPKLEKLKKQLKKKKSKASPISASKKQYKPDWLME